jgi:hypothetical protein
MISSYATHCRLQTVDRCSDRPAFRFNLISASRRGARERTLRADRRAAMICGSSTLLFWYDPHIGMEGAFARWRRAKIGRVAAHCKLTED